jgi:sugar/nucleoside kinase (ribokinase family)
MFDVVGVGANSLDLVCVLPDYPRADGTAKLQILNHWRSPGGQTATTLGTCAALGLRTAYVGTLGNDDAADTMREALAARGIDLRHVARREAPNPFAVILLAERQGERIVLWRREPGAALRVSDLPLDALRTARLVHVDDVDEDAAIAAARAARAAGVVVTTDIERATARTLELVDAATVPIFGEGVPEALTGASDPERALRALRARHAGWLCATLGARGALLLDGDRMHRVDGHRVAAVDTTGAGDVFRGAFIAGLLRGDHPAAVLRFANAAAAHACTRMGALASVPAPSDVDALLS